MLASVKTCSRPNPTAFALIKPPPNTPPYYVFWTVDHVEMPVGFELGEGDDLTAVFHNQCGALAHAGMPDFSIRNLGRPGTDLLLRVVFQVYPFPPPTLTRRADAPPSPAKERARGTVKGVIWG